MSERCRKSETIVLRPPRANISTSTPVGYLTIYTSLPPPPKGGKKTTISVPCATYSSDYDATEARATRGTCTRFWIQVLIPQGWVQIRGGSSSHWTSRVRSYVTYVHISTPSQSAIVWWFINHPPSTNRSNPPPTSPASRARLESTTFSLFHCSTTLSPCGGLPVDLAGQVGRGWRWGR